MVFLCRTEGKSTLPEWINSQGVGFEPRAGGNIRILGFFTNKHKKINNQVLMHDKSFNEKAVALPDNQAAKTRPPSTHCDLPDGMLQTARASDKSPHIGA